jgi:hypothetical protein
MSSRRSESQVESQIAIQDLWISCLKLGINLSHQSVPLTGLIADVGFLNANLDLMHRLLAWRRIHPSGKDSPSEVVLTSPLL